MEEKPKQKKKSIFKKIRNAFLWVTGILFVLLVAVFLLMKIPAVQRWTAHKTAAYISNKIDAQVTIRDASIDLFKHLALYDIYIEDKQGDTLLYANHFEVNLGAINPFAPSIKIRNIQLHKAYINLYRNSPDTVFNFQFIADAFSSGTDDTSAAKPMDIDLQRLVISETRYVMHDELNAQDISCNIGNFDLKVNTLDMLEEILAIEDLTAENIDFTLTKLLDTAAVDTTEYVENTFDSVVHIAPGNWIIEALQLNLVNCSFLYKNENSPAITKAMNFNDLAVSKINLTLSDITFVGDTLQGMMHTFACREKSGFQLNTLQTDFLFTPYEITLRELLVETPHSKISDYFKMQFATLNHFNDFEESIYMSANFTEAKVHTQDISYFAPVLSEYNITATLTADAKGTLSNIKARNMQLAVPDAGTMSGNLAIRGLPDIDETFIMLTMDPVQANLVKLNTMLGGDVIPENLLQLGNVSYKGQFTGFINDFVLNGYINSSAGDAYTDVNFKYDAAGKSTFIDGIVSTENLQIGKITGTENILGEVSANTNIKGSINGNKVNAEVTAIVNKLDLRGYSYRNIKIDGRVNDKLFDGNLSINDPNLQQTFSGKIDLNSETPTYDFVSDITYANLGDLNLYNKNIEVSLQATMNVKGKNLDDVIGTANLNKITIKDEATTYTLQSFQVETTGDSLQKNLNIRSDLLDADFTGDYSLKKLPSAIRNMIDIYVKGGQISEEVLENAQNVAFTVQVKDAKTLTQIFYPDVQEIRNLYMEGDLNTLNKKFFTRATAEKFTYNNINFNNTAIEIFTKNNKLNFFTHVKEIQLADNLTIPTAVLEGDFSKDSLNFNLKAGRDTDPERLNLFAGAYLADSLIRLNVLPSEIYLNHEKWEIPQNNSLQYDYKSLIADNFILQHNEKSIGLTSFYDATYGNILKFQLKNILIQDITQLLKYNAQQLSGVITANVNMSTDFSKPSFIGSGTITDLVMNGNALGYADITATLLYPNDKLNFNVFLKGENKLRATGFYITDGSDSILADIQITKIPLAIAEAFTRGIFSEMEGNLSGNIKLTGTLQNPVTQGFAELKQGAVKVDYLGTKYYLDNQKMQIATGKITIEPGVLKDKYGNAGAIAGYITHTHFDDFYFHDLTIAADKLLFMETTRKQNPDFWGSAIGRAKVIIKGPLENLFIDVTAKPLKDENVETIVYLPTFSSGNVSKHEFIKFINRQNTLAETNEKNVAIVSFSLALDITPDAEIYILLNSEETDVLKAKGTGNLLIEANTIDKLDMNGIITVTEGSYNFSFENLITKQFSLKPGGTIEFVKDPYKARLNLTAIYNANGVKVNSLTGGSEESVVNVQVLTNLTGLLESPEINFDLAIPGNSGTGLSTFDQKLQQVLQDKNELNKQVFGLLLANQFINTLSTDATTQSGTLQTGVNSTMTEFITNQLSSLFNDWLTEIFPNAELDIGYQKLEAGQLGTNAEEKQQFKVALEQKLFDDAVTIKIGGTYDYTQSSASSDASNLAGDFEVEYNITPDGRVKVKAFRRTEYDILGVRNDLTGMGLFYSKDFDTLNELFTKKQE
jgi:hypothetical protein